ncbi:MAG: PAS domain S-box protein [Candidatus Heimdallarchaeota archaeon]|nr:PAS domain S-box protein [Candidatus Heimdallarchaeota archaeon]
MESSNPKMMMKKHQKNNTIQVLHIDDETDFLTLSKDYVERLSNGEIQIDPLSDPSLALETLHNKEYDAVVCDYLMPAMDEVNLLRKIKEEKINIPFIIFTGRSREEVVIDALNLGADSYIRKSTDAQSQFTELISNINKVVEGKRVEAAFIESEEKFRYIFQHANDAVYLYPMKEDGMPGNFIEVNDNASKVLGYSKEEFLKLSPLELDASRTEKDILNIMKEVTKKKQMTFEVKHKTKEGKSIPVEISTHLFDYKGKQVLLSYVRDISNRNIRKEELQQSYNLYRTLFETTGTANLLFDEKGTIILFNSRMENLSGFTREDVEGKRKWLEFIPQPELDMMIKLNEIRKTDASLVPDQYESRFINNEGIIKNIILSVKTVPGTTNFLASITDITERKRAEDEISKQKEELSDFAHFMGHDIRNSLAAIEGYVEQLKEKYEDLYFEKILRRTNYVGNLLEHSIELAEAGTAVEKTDQVDLDRLVETVADVIIPKSIKFTKESLGTIKGDNSKLSQVFKNLFENSLAHGKPNKISVTKSEKKDKIVISISNDGIIIDEKIINKVFDRGFSSKKGSTGLGLSIVKKIVEGHGWEISIDKKEKLTNFRIEIPTN